MRTWLTATVLAALTAFLLVSFSASSCGGGKRSLPLPSINSQDGTPLVEGFDAGLDLVMTRDVSGAPSGVRLYWWRVNAPDTVGYYVYRDTQPIAVANPALRVNGGDPVTQPPEDQTAILFEDSFAAQVGITYYYRVSAVDRDGDESLLSQQRNITIRNYRIDGFSPTQARVGQTVTITGGYFNEYNEASDAVYFTGVRNTKGPSALQLSMVRATMLSWEDDRIRVSVPIGSTVGKITVQSNFTAQQSASDFQCLSPYITSFAPDPVNSGSNLDFYGANFGIPDGSNLLMVDDVAYGGMFRQWASDHVVASVPDTITTGIHKFQLLIQGEISNHCWIDVIAGNTPYISSITPNNVARDDEIDITIYGVNFGSVPENVDVVMNGVTIPSEDFWSFSDTQISFLIPLGVTLVGETYVIRHETVDLFSNEYIYRFIPGYQESQPDGVAAGFNMGEYSDTATVSSPEQACYVIYTDNTPGNEAGPSLFLAQWDYVDGGFDSEVLLNTWGEVRWPRIAVDSNGLVHFAYQRYGWMSEVRYGVWEPGVGVISEEQVYQASSFDTPGDYLDMNIFDDGAGGIDLILAWSMNESYVYCSYKLAGELNWTTDLVYSADTAYSEQVGYYCSLDVYREPVMSPPPASPPRGPSALGGFYIIGISYGLYSPDYTPNYELRFSYTTDLTSAWYWDYVDSSADPIKETVTRIGPASGIPYIAWCTDNTVGWAGNVEGWMTETVASGDGPYGAVLGLEVDSSGNQYIVAHDSEYNFFMGYRGDPDYTWDLEYFNSEGYREPSHAGRGGVQIFVEDPGISYGAHFCMYDGDMRDSAFGEFWTGGSSTFPWYDIGDGFATPGHLLSNQAVVVGEDGRPNVVFSDTDPQTGVNSLWFGHFVGETLIGGFSHLPQCQWEYTELDSVFSGTLGRATMAMDSSGDFHIAYQRNSQIVYMSGNPADGFSSPAVLETFTAIPTAGPQIALGTDSTQDVFIATQRPEATSQVVLLRSDDAMATHTLDVIFGTSNPISQYDLATRWVDGLPVVAAYLEGMGSAVSVYDDSTESSRSFSATSGMNRGLTLTIDGQQHYCITVANLSGSAGYLLSWDDVGGDYALSQFTSGAAKSLTMSQCRNKYGPVMTYINGDYEGVYWADAWVSMIDDMGRQEIMITGYTSEAADFSVYHSIDAYSPWLNVYALHPTAPEYSYLYVTTYAEIE